MRTRSRKQSTRGTWNTREAIRDLYRKAIGNKRGKESGVYSRKPAYGKKHRAGRKPNKSNDTQIIRGAWRLSC